MRTRCALRLKSHARRGIRSWQPQLMRAAELTEVPSAVILRISTLLHPKRASYDELMELAAMLDDKYDALENVHFIRDAAEIYRAQELLRPVSL
jgi:propanediol dehydratase small subunit